MKLNGTDKPGPKTASPFGILLLKMLAPWLAVLAGWVWLEQAWIALGLYHLQILLWFACSTKAQQSKILLLLGQGGGRLQAWSWAAVLIFALAWLLLPMFALDLFSWTQRFGLGDGMLLLMVFWFGLIHPLFEEVHWQPLRQEHPWLSACLFGAYHTLILSSLFGWPLSLLSALGLAGCSVFWAQLTKRSGSLWPAVIIHTIADFSLVLWAFLRLRANLG